MRLIRQEKKSRFDENRRRGEIFTGVEFIVLLADTNGEWMFDCYAERIEREWVRMRNSRKYSSGSMGFSSTGGGSSGSLIDAGGASANASLVSHTKKMIENCK